MGGHAGGLVDYQQMPILPDNGQRPIPGCGQDLGRAVVSGLHPQHVSGVDKIYGAGAAAVEQDSVFCPGQPGHGVGGKMQASLENVPDGGSILRRRDDFFNGFQGGGPLSFSE